MKAFLLHPTVNFDLTQALPRHAAILRQDLELDLLLKAMAGEDEFLLEVARKVVLLGFGNDVQTILYRHDVLRDSLKYPALIRQMYAFSVEAVEAKRKSYWSFASEHPSSVLHGSIDVLRMFMEVLKKMKALADQQREGQFKSSGVSDFIAMLGVEFGDAYFASVDGYLRELKFDAGILLSAVLGPGNEGTDFVLLRPNDDGPGFLQRILGNAPASYTFRLSERDETGAKAVAAMRNQGINRVANALAQSMEHIFAFFQMLRTELAFYVGCLNLHERLESAGMPTAMPELARNGVGPRHFSGLYDPCLALSVGRGHAVVGNTLSMEHKRIVVITGANQGGKSSFLRSIGLAQIMLQSGMFVSADHFSGSVCNGLYTHYKREEDPGMISGKLDEELGRMNVIAEDIHPDAMMLFNESFASTNEREGAEIARQITQALLERRIVVYFVTHLYTFAHSLFESGREDALFLRAQRLDDGTRTFRLVEGKPLETSYGQDLYQEVFHETPFGVS
ncbi:DNA mismatch repair protein MutS [Dyella jejuensis]|uniref:DNA mismatch repair protein MutS n=1 Tax=Dyella jejuensis TaxID=1432009 RepID=A0ABW8JI63_9GAMM